MHREVFLPANAQKKWKDPEVLSNAVENYEKHSSAKIAYDLDAALSKDWDKDTQIQVAREQGQYLASLGMCVILAIHDKGDGNPHCHYLCTARSIDESGRFYVKEKKVYSLDENGNRIPVLDEHGNQRMTKRKYKDKDGNEQISFSPQWQRETIYEDPLNR